MMSVKRDAHHGVKLVTLRRTDRPKALSMLHRTIHGVYGKLDSLFKQ
jgi:hypothetical protein